MIQMIMGYYYFLSIVVIVIACHSAAVSGFVVIRSTAPLAKLSSWKLGSMPVGRGSSNNITADSADDAASVDDEEQDEDFSQWMQGLSTQWPLLSTAPLTNTATEETSVASGRYRGNSIFTVADLLFPKVANGIMNNASATAMATSTTVQELIAQEEQDYGTAAAAAASWLQMLQKSSPWGSGGGGSSGTNTSLSSSRLSVTQSSAFTTTTTNPVALEALLQDATARMEYLVQEASALATESAKLLPSLLERLVVLDKQQQQQQLQPKQQQQEVEQQATANDATDFISVANALFTAGYVGTTSIASKEPIVTDKQTTNVRPLFADFASAQRVFNYNAPIVQGAEMARLAGSIYEDAVLRQTSCQALGHALVASDTTANVAWMVTDSVNEDNIWQRTITIRGFDASDDTVDREALLQVICNPSPTINALVGTKSNNNKDTPITSSSSTTKTGTPIMAHYGLYQTAWAIYQDVSKYMDWMAPQQRLVLNGHSIGGSLSVLLLMILNSERGTDWVTQRVGRVYTHGSPPIASVVRGNSPTNEPYHCPILAAMDLPSDMVYGYVQPYDPIVRFLTEYDPLYPLVDDLGADEITLYASGPRRSLRPITRAILSSWDGWPEFRQNWKSCSSKEQSFVSVGIQYVLLPDYQRYLTDRFVAAQVGVPPTQEVLRISSSELLPALAQVFPLDTFQISLIPQAVRSFLHHFYPAYDSSLVQYTQKATTTTSGGNDRVKKDNKNQQQIQQRNRSNALDHELFP